MKLRKIRGYMTKGFMEDYIMDLQKQIERLEWQGCCDHDIKQREMMGDTHQVATYTVEYCKKCGKYIEKHNTTDLGILYKDLQERKEENIILLGEDDNKGILIESEDMSTRRGGRGSTG